MEVCIKRWDNEIIKLLFLRYCIFKEKHSAGEEIGDVKVQTASQMLDELKKDTLDGRGSLNEISNVKDMVFYNS